LNSEQDSNERRSQGQPRNYDLEERLLEFASVVIDVSEKLPNTRAGNHLAGQFFRAGTSPYGNHGEAQEPESADDFIHKMKVCLKELRETRRWARLIDRKNCCVVILNSDLSFAKARNWFAFSRPESKPLNETGRPTAASRPDPRRSPNTQTDEFQSS